MRQANDSIDLVWQHSDGAARPLDGDCVCCCVSLEGQALREGTQLEAPFDAREDRTDVL